MASATTSSTIVNAATRLGGRLPRGEEPGAHGGAATEASRWQFVVSIVAWGAAASGTQVQRLYASVGARTCSRNGTDGLSQRWNGEWRRAATQTT